MADTIRKRIIDMLVEVLNDVDGMEGKTQVNAPDDFDLSSVSLPMAFIDSNMEDEDIDEFELGRESWSWKPIISVYFPIRETDTGEVAEEWLGKVHKDITNDRRFSGLVSETKRLTADVIDISAQIGLMQGLIMIWEIKYQHKANDPYTL